MISIKSKEEIKIMREGGLILADVIRQIAEAAKEGVRLEDLDKLAEKLIKKAGAKPAFLGYKPPGGRVGYPSSICVSLNEVVVHGLPTERKLKEGDVLKIDLGVLHKGFYTDSAVTVGIGKISPIAKKLMETTKKSLDLAIDQCRPGKHLGDIGWIINKNALKRGFKPVRGLTGHGIGRNLHEDPSVLNVGQRGSGLLLKVGMVLAIEPMLSAGSNEIIQLPDDSFATKDNSLSAHFEHTIAVTNKGPMVLTGYKP